MPPIPFPDEARRRFLTDVVARVPLEQLVEVHLFAPIRQGGAETGVAVVVARGPATDDADVAAQRHTIYSARYRQTIKGPDRGRWTFDAVEEADAPLLTVEAVVRGVQRRAGDSADPDRLDALGVAREIGVPVRAASGP